MKKSSQYVQYIGKLTWINYVRENLRRNSKKYLGMALSCELYSRIKYSKLSVMTLKIIVCNEKTSLKKGRLAAKKNRLSSIAITPKHSMNHQ